jgi:hypothetical protein
LRIIYVEILRIFKILFLASDCVSKISSSWISLLDSKRFIGEEKNSLAILASLMEDAGPNKKNKQQKKRDNEEDDIHPDFYI